MSVYARFNGDYIGVQPSTSIVYHEPNRSGAPGEWEDLDIKKRGQYWDVLATAAKVYIRLNEQTHQLETGADADGWGGQWILSTDGKSLTIPVDPPVVLTVEGYSIAAKPIHVEQRGNDFVDGNGKRISLCGCDGFDDLWFALAGRQKELDALMVESREIGFKTRRIWCMGDAGQNQVFSLYPQNIANYFQILRSLVAYENSYGIIPLFTAFVDAQIVMPDNGAKLAFWQQLNQSLKGSGSYLVSGWNQHSKNGSSKEFGPKDLTPPDAGVIWSRGSDTDDVKTSPDGSGGKAAASELHATRIGFDRALMDATASPPNMRAAGATMVWMTEQNPFDVGSSPFEAWQMGRVYATCWALAIFHNRQGQRGQLLAPGTRACAQEWVRGMTL